jgi:hypothetical protein
MDMKMKNQLLQYDIDEFNIILNNFCKDTIGTLYRDNSFKQELSNMGDKGDIEITSGGRGDFTPIIVIPPSSKASEVRKAAFKAPLNPGRGIGDEDLLELEKRLNAIDKNESYKVGQYCSGDKRFHSLENYLK